MHCNLLDVQDNVLWLSGIGCFTLQQTHMHYWIIWWSVLLASFHAGAPRRFGTQVASLTKTIKSILDRYPEGGQILKVLFSLHCTSICLLNYLDAWYFKARTELDEPFFNRGGRQEALDVIKRNEMFTRKWQHGPGRKALTELKWSIDCTSQPDSIPCYVCIRQSD